MISLRINKKDKKGISIVIGYILLIAISIVISIFVYQWLKTYVPREALKCPDGVSVFIKDISYDCTSGSERLGITIKNNGKFSVAGYFIHVSNSSDKDSVSTIDISNDIIGGDLHGNSVVYLLTENGLTPDEPNNVKSSLFDVSKYGTIYKVEIIPTRWQEVENKKRFVSCSNAKVEEIITCGEEVYAPGCTDTCNSLGYECETWTICDEDVDCGEGQTCEDLHGAGYICSAGNCVEESSCTDTCESLGYECETYIICGESTICGDCTQLHGEGYICSSGVCTEVPPSICGDGTCDDGECISGCTEDCDVEDCCGIEGCNEDFGETCETCSEDCGCDAGYTCEGGHCVEECTSHSYFQCYDTDVYWYDSCDNREEKKEECGTSGYVGDNYCYRNDVYRDYTKKGCSGSSCTSSTSRKKQEECGALGCDDGECVGTKIICTELYTLGLMDEETYKMDITYAHQHFSSEAIKGYQAWAIPVVRIMRKEPETIKLIIPLVDSFMEEIAYRVGKEETGNEVGELFLDKGIPLFERIGVLINEPDWEVLFGDVSQNSESNKYDKLIENYFTEEKIKEMFYDALKRSGGSDIVFANELLENLEKAVEEIELMASHINVYIYY